MQLDFTVRIYTDGACRNNQNKNNVGAWAYRLEQLDKVKEVSGVEINTTNNKMELTAVIKALEALNETAKAYKIIVYSDSNYVVQGVNSWRASWEAKCFAKVANSEYWQYLYSLVDSFSDITFVWVPGHSTVLYNNKVDKLCNDAMDAYLRS